MFPEAVPMDFNSLIDVPSRSSGLSILALFFLGAVSTRLLHHPANRLINCVGRISVVETAEIQLQPLGVMRVNRVRDRLLMLLDLAFSGAQRI